MVERLMRLRFWRRRRTGNADVLVEGTHRKRRRTGGTDNPASGTCPLPEIEFLGNNRGGDVIRGDTGELEVMNRRMRGDERENAR